jgi:hypothetical protein
LLVLVFIILQIQRTQFWFFEIQNKEPLILVTSKNFKEPAVLMKELVKTSGFIVGDLTLSQNLRTVVLYHN